MVVTFVVIMVFALVLVAVLVAAFVMIVVTIVALMENFRLFPRVTLTRNSSEEQTGGKQVKGFHLRRV